MRRISKAVTALAAMAAATAFAGAAHAADAQDGKWEIKVLGTAVLPDGKVKSVKVDALNVTGSDPLALGAAGSVDIGNTVASDNGVPTVAIEYYFTPNISLETICCVTGHHVTISAGNLKGVVAVDNVQIVPATFTAKYHLPLGPIKPYVGVGPTLFIVLADSPSAAVKGLGVTRTKLSSEFGVAVQAGVDVALNKHYGLSIDAKKYWVSTDATFYDPAVTATNGVLLKTRHKLDPWVLSAGVYLRF